MKSPLCTVLPAFLFLFSERFLYSILSPPILFICILLVILFMVIFIKFGLFKKVYMFLTNILITKMTNRKEDKQFDAISREITMEDAILILMYANKNKPITGRLMFVKQIFLLIKEIFPFLDEPSSFYPAQFGPFSVVFAKTIDKLIEDGDIKAEYSTDDMGNELHRFTLTGEGIHHASVSFDKLPDTYKDLIIRKRKGWDQLGYTGIVRLVYAKYPEYTIYSKIKEEVE